MRNSCLFCHLPLEGEFVTRHSHSFLVYVAARYDWHARHHDSVRASRWRLVTLSPLSIPGFILLLSLFLPHPLPTPSLPSTVPQYSFSYMSVNDVFTMYNSILYNLYATLIQDIKDKQISSELTCVEVGCRGYVSESNKIRITTILKSLDIKPSKRQVKELTLSLSKLALLTSFVIFQCKDEPEWFEPKLIVE